MNIPFSIPTKTDNESAYLNELAVHFEYYPNKFFSNKCKKIISDKYGIKNLWLTKSCTQSLELAGLIAELKQGDEVIMPSYAFVSDANAVALCGATCVYVDIRKDTMNIDENKIEAAITPNTKAIITINYSGVSCNYDVIVPLAKKYGLILIEDNAHGIFSKYKGEYLGTFGDISTISFDHLKNITSGEGGCVMINEKKMVEKFSVIYEFGTNKVEFLKGLSSKYEWKSKGTNSHLSEYLAAILLSQLENGKEILEKFHWNWNTYHEQLLSLHQSGALEIPMIPDDCEHSAHIFYIKLRYKTERDALLSYLKSKNIHAAFHYVPLHTSEYGRKHGRFHGDDINTTKESERLLRLPNYHAMTINEISYVTDAIRKFF